MKTSQKAAVFIAAFIVVAAAAGFYFKSSYSPRNSLNMAGNKNLEPIVKGSDTISVKQAAIAEIKLGDIVVYEVKGSKLVGLACGLPGDRIAISNGVISRNDQASDCGHPDFKLDFERTADTLKVGPDEIYILKSIGADSALFRKAFTSSEILGTAEVVR